MVLEGRLFHIVLQRREMLILGQLAWGPAGSGALEEGLLAVGILFAVRNVALAPAEAITP